MERLTTASASADYFAVFQNDVYCTVPRADVALITETLLGNASATVAPDLLWLNTKSDGRNKPKAEILASMQYRDRTLELRQVAYGYTTNAFLLRKTCASLFARQLERGYRVDEALNLAARGMLQVVVTEGAGTLFNLTRTCRP